MVSSHADCLRFYNFSIQHNGRDWKFVTGALENDINRKVFIVTPDILQIALPTCFIGTPFYQRKLNCPTLLDCDYGELAR